VLSCARFRLKGHGDCIIKKLLDILACPVCRAILERRQDELICVQAGHRFPIVNGVPVLFPDGRLAEIQHEADLTVRTGYDPWVHRNVLQSLTADRVVLDIGSGNMTLDDPCIVRMDVTLTPYVDLVADAHALPFRDESLDYVMSLAVLEHLRQPFVAGQEMYRVLKPGGYVYADTNFVFAYHGYPHHYFNSTLHGIEQVFAAFAKLRSGVAPYQMPSYAIENILSTYLHHFKPDTAQVLNSPLRAFDAKFTQDIAYRFSAGVFYLGYKCGEAQSTVIPDPIMRAYAQDSVLRERFPNPCDLTNLDNLMTWSRREGRQIDPEIARCLDAVPVFSKYWDDRPLDRTWIESLPLEEKHAEGQATSEVDDTPDRTAELRPTPWRKLPVKAWTALAQRGLRGLLADMGQYMWWRFSRQ
jgi:uncharacterized protein YbaR (Trm112 family)